MPAAECAPVSGSLREAQKRVPQQQIGDVVLRRRGTGKRRPGRAIVSFYGSATGEAIVKAARAGQIRAMPITPEQEPWAEALAIHLSQGDEAPLFVAQRLGALALGGDLAGIERWRRIAERLDAIRSCKPQ
jgi:hypothetical protein